MISSTTFQQIDAWVDAQVKKHTTPGLSLAITDRTDILHTAAFGLANIDRGEPLRPDHLIEIGSIGKSFTACAILQLVDEGLIDLHAPVTDYLPWFSVQSEFEPITLHHLLSHTAGISAGFDFAPDGAIQVWALRDSVATTPPGTYFHYSNLGYKVVGAVLERLTGETYGPVIQRRVLDRLGATDSEPVITNATRERLAVGYGPAYDDRPWWPGRSLAPATWLETDTADGCLAMTAADLAVYLRMFLNRGEATNGRVLSPGGFELISQKAIELTGGDDPLWYGYGLLVRDAGGHTYLGHSGGMVGYFAGMIGDMESGLGVTALINGPGEPNWIARTVLNYLRTVAEGREDAALPEEPGPDLSTFSQYVVAYSSSTPDGGGKRKVTLALEGDSLVIHEGDIATQLTPLDDDLFVSEHAPWDLFPTIFERDDDEVTRFVHGAEVFTREGRDEPDGAELPVAWLPFPGHYRAHNPWATGFRVVNRRGRLWLIVPSEPDGLEAEQPLLPLLGGWFRCGEDERLPERIRFDTIVEGRALRANLSGSDFYRVRRE